jgi:glucuronate isomerase
MSNQTWNLPQDRYFDPDPAQRCVARDLYASVAGLPLICPHGHVNPRLLADDEATFGSPADLLIIPDHYVFRMLYAHGVPLESLGIAPRPGAPAGEGNSLEPDHRRIWQTFAEHFHLFRGTPTGIWLAEELHGVFRVEEKLTAETAQAVYDQIETKLAQPEFRPRALFERFGIEVLCTTDAAHDSLTYHRAIRASAWKGRVLPTFRPDGVTNLLAPGWRDNVADLSQAGGIDVDSYRAFIRAIEDRRAYFQEMGATATDQAAETAYTEELDHDEAEAIFQRALRGQATADDARRFTGHMIVESARLSLDDGLVMQLHVGSFRNHNAALFRRFGPDMGADIPVQSEFTRNLRPLLGRYGNEAGLTLILFTLDESAYARELAPLAGHYPALRLGPPWWFHDSLNGMRRYFDRVVETAGLYNTAGFNDDTRAFPSIPARHDVWRRAACNWLAGLVVRGVVDEQDAGEMARDAAYGLAREAYRL